jgi:KDO2-lipid IV(A) lauroyltransferase
VAEFIVGSSLRKLARRHRALQTMLWRLDFALVWLLIKLFRILPVDVASRIGRRVGAWIGPRLREKNAKYRENLATAFPELDDGQLDALLRRSWGQAGRVLAEYPHLDKILKDKKRLQIEIREPIATYSDPTTPCVIVTAHLSNWEVVCTAMARLGIPNASLYSPPTNPLLAAMLEQSRRALNCELLPRDNSARLLMRALKNGRTAAMVMDRRIDEGKAIPFFGHDKSSTLVPARLALKYDCDLVPAQVERLEDASFRVTFHPPIRPQDPTASEEVQATDMITQVHAQFESWIREQPEDWFCSKRLWTNSKMKQHSDKADSVGGDRHAA